MSVPHLLRRRRARAARLHRSFSHQVGRLGVALLLALAAGVALLVLSLALAYTALTRDLPSLEALPALLHPPAGLLLQPTRVYDRSGTHLLTTLENPYLDVRQYLPLDPAADTQPLPQEGADGHLPPALAAALVAARDPDFWHHAGFRLRGDPTLTEALVTDLLLYAEPPGAMRTWRARLLAAQLTARYGRLQVLEWFLNSADFGHYLYGAANAARAYLGKEADRLTVGEAALLAAVSQAPDLNPWDAPELALQRRDSLLESMQAQGWLTPEQAAAARAERPRFTRPPQATAVSPPAQLALAQAARLVPLAVLQRGGWRIHTTLDWEMQSQMTCLLTYWRTRAPRGDVPPADCPAARLLALPAGGQAAAFVALDPLRGQVLAWAQTGAAADAHPLGTTLTPFLYLTAFTRGKSPASLVWDVPLDLPLALPPNPDGEHHGPMRLRIALANDYLTPAATLIPQLGVETLARTLEQLGFEHVPRPTLDEAAATFLGGLEGSPLALAQAYGVLANQGVLVAQGEPSPRPLALRRLERLDGRRVWDCESAPESCGVTRTPVVSAQLAYLLTDVLKDEAARWPTLGHPNPLEIGQPVAAKLGQVADAPEGWTAGYTPHLSLVAWVRAPEAAAPALNAASLWRAFLQYHLQNHPPPPWHEPPGLSHVTVCETSGMLPTPECPSVVDELFLNGTEPAHRDTLYRTYLVNRETGRLATVFTPPELVEKRVYLVVPAQAAAWAAQAGLPTPPEEYDLLAAPPPNPDVHITSPALFAYVAGQVTVRGTARGAGMAFYRLQVGPGLNPQRWTQIGPDATTPVDEGVLGRWDTSGLQGLYTLQLQVVYADQRVALATTQVTVDNEPPTVRVLTPADGEALDYRPGVAVPLLAEPEDEFGIAAVTFTLNGRSLGTLSEPPYRLPWPMRVGRFTLRVTATDLAGNTASTQITFTVQR